MTTANGDRMSHLTLNDVADGLTLTALRLRLDVLGRWASFRWSPPWW